ncbi:11940_t:CDS:2, partial [Racocetra fulgida]
DSINHYFFPNSGKDSTQLVELTITEQESKIDQLRTYLEELGHPLETIQLEKLLEGNSWNVMEVADYCDDLIEAEYGLVSDIRKDVIMLGSENDRFTSCYIDENENPTQEDASELFLFLSCLYELPYLPLGIHLFHGGSKDPNDERVITERLIQVAIPGDPHDETPVSLEEVLITHFHDNVVSGIKRFSSDDMKQTEIPVSAWQMLKLLPFYSASNEQ